ncbi:MAG: fimbrillin family protein [Bacteroidales bacterium]|nr:fimbrillin family protein [Bacteroidales bacterium]
MSSCSQEDMPGSQTAADDLVSFHVSLPGVSSRSEDTNKLGALASGFFVTAFCDEDESLISGDGTLGEYFSEQKVTQGIDGKFRSDLCHWPGNKGEKEGHLKFFAFYPSRADLRQSVDDSETSSRFELTNHSSASTYSYNLEKFKINKDIARHVDFVAAAADGTETDNLFTGVELNFQHQMTRVGLRAWGNNASYDVEIAGVRIGRPVVEGTFNFAAVPDNPEKGDNSVGAWALGESPTRDCVEYIFRESGDVVIPIDGHNNNSANSASSIMGNGGWSMVIPYTHEAWNHHDDAPNTLQGMYFSVLLRITDKSGIRLYPYPGDSSLDDSAAQKMTVIYLAVETSSGRVMKRLYKNDSRYFTDTDFNAASEYVLPATQEIREYGWAALPIATAWKAGYEYTYLLDYSQGVGLHDPDDPNPGTPILNEVAVSTIVNQWQDAVGEHEVIDLTVIDNSTINIGK